MNIPNFNIGFDILRNVLGQGEINQECREGFKKCKNQFKEVAKNFMEQVKANNEMLKKKH